MKRKLIRAAPETDYTNLLFISIWYKQKQINLFELDLIGNYTFSAYICICMLIFFFSVCVSSVCLQKSLGIEFGTLECIAVVAAWTHRMGYSQGYRTLAIAIRPTAWRCSQFAKTIGKFFNFKTIWMIQWNEWRNNKQLTTYQFESLSIKLMAERPSRRKHLLA